MEVEDWRSVSQHYVREMIVRALEQQHVWDNYKPTILVAASEDALAVARIVRGELKARMGSANGSAHDDHAPSGAMVLPVLTQKLELHDEETNPYNVHITPWTGSFSGQRVLLVDKADNSRTSIVAFCQHLLQVFAEQKQKQQQDGAAADQWIDPQIGVFVLHNKRRPKAAELPPEVLAAGRYFVGEETDNLQIAYPFNIHDHNTQPQAHGAHASGTAHPAQTGHVARRSTEGARRNAGTPPPSAGSATATLRAMSTHYIETILESTVDNQHLLERFPPTMLVAASDDALPAARLLRHYLRHRMHSGAQQQPPPPPQEQQQGQQPQQPQQDLPLLTPRLELYDEDLNPYLAHIKGVKEWGPASLAGQRVLVVDRVDSSRMTLSTFVAQLAAGAAGAREAAQAEGRPWGGDPTFGVFVLHNKKVDKHADLPPDILENRYFVCEESEDVQIAYPFSTK